MSRHSTPTWPWRLGLPVVAMIFPVPAPAHAAAQSAAAKYTLAELIGLAVERNPLLASHDARVEERRLSAEQARVWTGPSLDASGGGRREGSTSGPRYEAAISQPLPLLGKPGLRGGLMDLETKDRRVLRSAAQTTVTLLVVKLAYEYAVNRRKADFLEKRRLRFELVGSYLAGREFFTPQRKAESHIVENRLKAFASDTIRSQAGYKASLEKLRVHAPLPAGSFPEIEAPWFSGARELDQREWLAAALDNNPDLRAQRFAIESAGLEHKLASRDALPDPSITASYEEGRAAETEKNFGIGLSLAFPAWNGNRAGILSAGQKKLAEERLLNFQEQRLRGELPRAILEYEAARRIVQKHPQTVLVDLESELLDAEAGFRKGQVDLLTFLELDSAASETFYRVLDAQLGLLERAAELLELRGEQEILAQLGSF